MTHMNMCNISLYIFMKFSKYILKYFRNISILLYKITKNTTTYKNKQNHGLQSWNENL